MEDEEIIFFKFWPLPSNSLQNYCKSRKIVCLNLRITTVIWNVVEAIERAPNITDSNLKHQIIKLVCH